MVSAQERLSAEELVALAGQLDEGWKVVESIKIERHFAFSTFEEAIAFVNKVAEIAEAENHHPDIHVTGFKNVLIELWTHRVGGLSEKDFAVAVGIDQLKPKG